MHNTLDWTNSEDTRDIVHIVVQALVEGRGVVVPGDTGYSLIASGLNPQSAEHFRELSAAGRIGEFTLLLRSGEELRDYVADLSAVAARMASRGWPGPLVLKLPVESERSLLAKLPPRVRSLVDGNGHANFRVAGHEAIQQALRLMPGPLLAANVVRDGRQVTLSGEAGQWTGAALVVDDGPLMGPAATTIVEVADNRCRLLQPGGLEQAWLVRAAQFVVLFICTGNTCRSPMAEALLRAKFAKRFGGPVQAARAAYVASAGLSAFPGGPASVEAHAVMSQRGLSLAEHQSRSVTEHALQQADLILTMTRSHRQAILEQLPRIESKVHLVSGTAADVTDPFGGSQAVYVACADQIDAFLEQWNRRLDDSLFPVWNFA